MDDLLAEFVAETREMLQASEGELVAWETDPSDSARLDAIFRFVHTVKGNCGFFDFPQLERLSHAAESALAEVRAERRQADGVLVSAVLAVIDRIAEIVTAIENGDTIETGKQDDALVLALEHDTGDLGEVASQAKAAASSSGGTGTTNPQRTIRLPVDLLDRVMSGVSDLVLARNDLARRLRDETEPGEIAGQFDRLSAILVDVREAVSRMRMQRIEHLFNSVPRMVRDLSNELGKQVMVEIDGNGVELDREMIELMRDPLTHIIRNAIDHGIETPAQRIAAGKHEIGLLSLSASQSGNRILLEISDDGRGLDTESIGKKAVASGIATQAELDALDKDAILNLIFAPGLSTAEEVSAISGRGVGMDVVRSNIERLGGSISVATTPGEQTAFRLTLPLTLTIIGGLTVAVADQLYAIPRSIIDEIVHARSHALELVTVGDAQLVTFRGERIRFLDLRHILALEETCASSSKNCGALVIAKLATGERLALGVDSVLDHEELVIKPLSPEVAAAKLYSGFTLLDDGRPLLLLDILKLAQTTGMAVHEAARIDRVFESDAKEPGAEQRQLMLFEGLDGKRRAISMDLIQRIDAVDANRITLERTRAQVVIEDRIFAVSGVDDQTLLQGPVRLIRLSDGTEEQVYAAREIFDTITLTEPLIPDSDDPTVEGVTLVDGEPVPILDGHWLFAQRDEVKLPDSAPLCRLPANDPWSSRILEPLVTAAGYRIAQDDDPAPDIIFASAEGALESEASPDAATIYLRSERHVAPGNPASIYRYDREGILAALRKASAGGGQ